jgi:hypothetical protein
VQLVGHVCAKSDARIRAVVLELNFPGARRAGDEYRTAKAIDENWRRAGVIPALHQSAAPVLRVGRVMPQITA